MQDPFTSFLGEEPSAASGGMSPNAAGQPALPYNADSPQDAQPVEAAQPLAVPDTAPTAVEVPAPTSKLKMVAGLVFAGALAYWLFKGKARPVNTNPRRRSRRFRRR